MRIIEETLAPGAAVTDIARRHGIATSLVFGGTALVVAAALAIPKGVKPKSLGDHQIAHTGREFCRLQSAPR
jgi:hypothetical protein